jgi:hypothetical protein
LRDARQAGKISSQEVSNEALDKGQLLQTSLISQWAYDHTKDDRSIILSDRRYFLVGHLNRMAVQQGPEALRLHLDALIEQKNVEILRGIFRGRALQKAADEIRQLREKPPLMRFFTAAAAREKEIAASVLNATGASAEQLNRYVYDESAARSAVSTAHLKEITIPPALA